MWKKRCIQLLISIWIKNYNWLFIICISVNSALFSIINNKWVIIYYIRKEKEILFSTIFIMIDFNLELLGDRFIKNNEYTYEFT